MKSRTADGLTAIAVAWCRTHNAMVRFESDGSVTVKVNGKQRRRPVLIAAVNALAGALAAPERNQK